MTYFIVWSTWLHTIWFIAAWWQAKINRTIEWPYAFFSHTSGRVADSVLKRDFFITSNHLIVLGCVCCCKMSQPSKRQRFLQSSELAELFLDTDIVTRQYQATPVQLREVLKVCQGCRIHNLTAKQPVVLSPAVQFRPVPLMQMKPLRLGQVNRLDRQWPNNGHAPLALRAV